MTTLDEGAAAIQTAHPVTERRAAKDWAAWYLPAALAVDLAAGSLASAAAYVIRFGVAWPLADMSLAVVMPFAWVAALASRSAYRRRYVGPGADEHRRVVDAAVLIMAAVAVASYAVKAEISRGYMLLVALFLLPLALCGRALLRRLVVRGVRAGRYIYPVMVVGEESAARKLIERLHTGGEAALKPVALWCPPDDLSARNEDPADADGARYDDIVAVARRWGARGVVVASGPEMAGQELRRISWVLERADLTFFLETGLLDVTLPRLSVRNVGSASLLQVSSATQNRLGLLAKAVIDRGLAGILLAILMPLFVFVAVAIHASDRGPVFFRQVRVGQGGRRFTIWKFRTMVADAEARRGALEAANESDGPLFKIRDDPRRTGVGAVLRRYSIDELPQLFNVVAGQMSLVGPRPALPDEVARYDSDTVRRLAAKPGMTGLWQVSGRASLSWEESVRYDVRYVDNWSLSLDTAIMVRTAKAVLGRDGAY